MESLIQKAIQAINEGKTERAIGLLEGALEMKGFTLHKPIEVTAKMPDIKIAPIMPTSDPESSMMDMQAKAKIKEIESMIKYE